MGIFSRSGQGKKKGEEGYGQGRASIATGDDVLLDEEEMVQRLLACLERPDYRPPTLPSVAVELMKLAQQPEVDFADIIQLLERDSLIAGRVLRLVQSPVYSGASQIKSIGDALTRLGLRTLRDLVMEISMNMKVFRSADYADTMELLRRHASATAHLAKRLCHHTDVDGEYAFMAGLLHDVGIAGTLLALSDRKKAGEAPPDLIAIWPALHRMHERAGEIMAEHWQLPAEIRTVLASHHNVLVKGTADPLTATVCLADHLAHEVGYGVVPKEDDRVEAMTELEADCVRSHTAADRSSERTLGHAREALGFDEAQMETIRAEAAEVAERIG